MVTVHIRRQEPPHAPRPRMRKCLVCCIGEYLGQQLVHLDVRPKRAAFLFRSGSKAEFCAAVERASSRWGGIQEPILPVSKSGRIQPAWLQVAEVLEPDVAFDMSGLPALGVATAEATLGLPVLPVHREDHPWYGAHPLVVEQRSGPAVHEPRRAPAAVAGLGVLPSWSNPEHWAEAGVHLEHASTDVESAVAQLRRTSVIDRCGEGCAESSLSGFHGGFALLWIAPADSLRDALWFWNIRALMPRSFVRAPVALVTPAACKSNEVRLALEELKAQPRWSSPDIFIVGLMLERSDLEQAAIALGVDVVEGTRVSFHLGSERTPDDPLTAALQLDPRSHLLGGRGVGLRSSALHTIERPTTTIRQPSPVKWARGNVGGHVIIRWTAPFTLVPRRPAVARLFTQNGQWKYDGLEIETDANPLYHFSVDVPSPAAVLEAALADAGLRFERSQPGRLADALLRRLSRDRLIFADSDVQKVVAALTTPRSKRLAKLIVNEAPSVTPEAATVLADRIGSRLSQLACTANAIASRAAISAAKAAQVAERLVQADLADRGLVVDCTRCGLQPFVLLRDSTRRGRCPACRAPSGYALSPNDVPAVHYRLNALLDRASDQGVVPHLAVLQRLDPDPAASSFVLGAHLFSSDEVLGEVDLLGYDGERLACGEVKTTSTGFTPRDVEKTIRLAEAARCNDVVFGCTDVMSEAVVNDLFAAAPSELRVRVVTAEAIVSTPFVPPVVAEVLS